MGQGININYDVAINRAMADLASHKANLQAAFETATHRIEWGGFRLVSGSLRSAVDGNGNQYFEYVIDVAEDGILVPR